MLSFSLWIKIIFILALTVTLHNETAVVDSVHASKVPDCDKYARNNFFCTREMDEICATNGKTYNNECVFCSEMLKAKRKFGYKYDGRCDGKPFPR
ncbi:sperm-associated acrosin inhibitor-like [Nannospalax galili]|uniref:sperm-associated acrosin inhibitor-like n=1 Tax=Nannospalax galili TaxID=1026970 RepID=UPI000819D517|nr:sperm-associated acrosin inhibitor-like [Nannospalax galili]